MAPRVTIGCTVCGSLFKPSGKERACAACRKGGDDTDHRRWLTGYDAGFHAAQSLAAAEAQPTSPFARGFRLGYAKGREHEEAHAALRPTG